MSLIGQLLEIPSTDPEERRRARLLNVMLLGVGSLVLIALISTIVIDIVSPLGASTFTGLYSYGLATLLGVAVIFAINRYGRPWIASSFFLLLLTIGLSFADAPEEVVGGRSLFLLAIPILMASVLIRSYASFVAAGVVGVFSVIVGLQVLPYPNPYIILGFFAFAFISWLASRSLEHALEEVRTVNRELDQRVEDRTRDLAEALAREHAEASKNQAVLTGIADGVIVFDQEGQAIVANPAVGRLLDRRLESIVGCDIEALMGNDVDPEDKEVILDMLANQEVGRTSVKFEWAGKTLSVSFAPVRDISSRMMGSVAVLRDFSREAEVDRMKSDFVSIVSHEVRTPLTSIKGYLDLVLMGASGTVNMQQQTFLTIARDNAERLNEMVTDLLDISRIESGRIELNVQVVSLPLIVNQVVNTLRQEYNDRGLTLGVDIPPDLPEIFGDPGRITQIIYNLLSNACKYTPEGGVTIRAHTQQGAIQVDVTDTGIGISSADQAKLFGRFFRAEDTRVRQQPGTGLGLHITRSLVEMHGGRIWIESKPAQGSTFSFTLPLPAGSMPATARTAKIEVAPPAPAASPVCPCVLVVDDDPDVAQLFKLQLEQEGYRVTSITQASKVVDMARELQPDLITLDLLMDVDGLVVLSQLKGDPQTCDIPVVIVSVMSGAQQGLVLGAADYLVKPLKEGELLSSVNQVLGRLDSQRPNKILVVDDEPDIVGWLGHMLRHYGYEVSEAFDGLQALESAAANPPDLILLDLRMPRLDGRATIRRLREQEETRHIPIIVLTASSQSEDSSRAQMLNLGVQEFLRKPVTIERLVEEVREHLSPSHPPA